MQVIKDNKPTLLGLLVFSKQEALQDIGSPTFNIAVTQYRGVSKVSQNIEEVSIDDKEFNGTVLEQFDNALKFIISKLPVHSEISTELKRKEYLAIPEIAIRETLANAIAHRDYTNRTARIQIDIYSDRVEFANPGRSLVPIENIDNATPQSRNPLLIKFLRDYSITETRGRGIRTILNATKDSGLPMPKFENNGEIFKTTLFTSAFVQENDHNWLAQFRKKYKLKDTQLVALLELKHNPAKGLSNPEYCKLNNMEKKGDDRKARYEITMLVENDILIKQGENRYTRYYLNPKFLDE
jgi:ATP-dependent DNA helicase RecG